MAALATYSAHSSSLHSSDMVPARVDGAKATENTWLRHHYGELEQRVLQLKKDIAALRTAATKISKSLGVTAKKEPKTRSSK